MWSDVLSEADETSLYSVNPYLDESSYLLRVRVLPTLVYKRARGNALNRARENYKSFVMQGSVS